MKKIMFPIVFVFLTFASCNSKMAVADTALLDGTWQLNYITGPKIAFAALYPDKMPTIIFDTKNNKIVGNNSCNQYFGTLLLDGRKINFKDAKLGMTMMACDGSGDDLYMETLQKIESYTITDEGKTLSFLLGDIVMMRFLRQ